MPLLLWQTTILCTSTSIYFEHIVGLPFFCPLWRHVGLIDMLWPMKCVCGKGRSHLHMVVLRSSSWFTLVVFSSTMAIGKVLRCSHQSRSWNEYNLKPRPQLTLVDMNHKWEINFVVLSHWDWDFLVIKACIIHDTFIYVYV